MSSRGGSRPGACAPKGNANRLVHGRRSRQIDKAIERALADPQGRALILELVRRYSPQDTVFSLDRAGL